MTPIYFVANRNCNDLAKLDTLEWTIKYESFLDSLVVIIISHAQIDRSTTTTQTADEVSDDLNFFSRVTLSHFLLFLAVQPGFELTERSSVSTIKWLFFIVIVINEPFAGPQ